MRRETHSLLLEAAMAATVTAKGQITIPMACLRELGWIKGKTKLRRSKLRGAVLLTPVQGGEEATSR